MRIFLLALFAGLCLIGPAQAQRALPQPKVIAVYFYADWCPNCTMVTPTLNDARTTYSLDRMDILFVKLDLTNKDRIHQSLLLAKQLGIGEFVQAQGSATGYIAVLDGADKHEIVRFDKRDTKDKIGARLQMLAR